MEFNLSEYRFETNDGFAIPEENVKEFIKLLKIWYYNQIDGRSIERFLLETAGDKLNGN